MAFISAVPIRTRGYLPSRAFCPVTPTHRPRCLRAKIRQIRQVKVPVHIVASERIAKDGDCVLVHYTGYLDDGTQFDSSLPRKEPLSFVVGSGKVIRGFDDMVRGLSIGAKTRTRIEAKNAYGERRDDLIVKIERKNVPEGMKFVVGSKLPLSNGMMGLVTEMNEENITLDVNHELAGKPLTFEMELVGFAETKLPPVEAGLKRAIFGLGCFWGAELAYQRVNGVTSTKVGYTQGEVEEPSYQQVCSGSTGHAEAVAIDYDENVVKYEQLLDLFWERLGDSALTKNQVGNDVGTQYRSGIYWMDQEQEQLAVESKKKMDDKFGKETVVEIAKGEDVVFWLAEQYHQRYLEKGGQSAEKGATETIRCYG